MWVYRVLIPLIYSLYSLTHNGLLIWCSNFSHHLRNGVIGFCQRCPQLLSCGQWVWLFFKKWDLCCWLSLALVPLCSSCPTLLVICFWRSFPNNKLVRSNHVSSSLNELTIFMAQHLTIARLKFHLFLHRSASLISGIVAFWNTFWSCWSLKSRPLTPDLILDQTSGLTLVLLHFCSSQVWCCLKDFLSTYHLTTFSGSFYLLSWQLLGPHHLKMPHQDRIQRQWTLKNHFQQFSQISDCPCSVCGTCTSWEQGFGCPPSRLENLCNVRRQWLWYVSKALNHALGDWGFNAFN